MKVVDIKYNGIKSENTDYGVIWEGKSNNIECIIKVVILDTGIHYNKKKDKYYDGDVEIPEYLANKYFLENYEKPFYHRKYDKRKAMNMDKFTNEVKMLKIVSDIGLAPMLLDHWIDEKSYKIHYGFIVMERLSTTIKEIISSRNLSEDEDRYIKSKINKLHKHKIKHGDLKPSNICVNMNKSGQLKHLRIIDWAKGGYINDEKEIDRDRETYINHVRKNIIDRDGLPGFMDAKDDNSDEGLVDTLNISVNKTLDYLKSRKYNDLAYLLEETWNLRISHRTKQAGYKEWKNRNNEEDEMWAEQIAINLPVLYLASIYLHNYVRENGIKHLLFATRDCVHWHKIYKAIYPNSDVHYFHCSRNMFNRAKIDSNNYYDKYIDDITNREIRESVYVDIHGTGKRMYEFFLQRGKGGPSCFILSSRHSDSSSLSDGIKDLIQQHRAEFIVFKSIGSSIEMLNYDLIGTCNNYDRSGPIRAPLEYDSSIVKPYHDCSKVFIDLIKKHRNKIIHSYDHDNLKQTIKHLFLPIRDNLPSISKWIEPERHHDIN